jgi:hypothetical protein
MRKFWLLGALLMGCQAVPNGVSTPLGVDIPGLPRSAELIVSPATPRALPLLTQRYRAEVRDTLTVNGQTWHLVSMDLSRSPVTLRQDLLAQALPAGAAFPVLADGDQEATAIAWLDLMAHHRQEFQGLHFNSEAALPSAPAFNDLDFRTGDAQAGWWRKVTRVEEAWNYSLGTGARAGYIDLGFRAGHPEVNHRLILNGRNNQTQQYRQEPNVIDKPTGDHGMASLLVGFAERDNFLPTVGVAPNAQVVPYVASSTWEVARAVLAAAQDQPDVIGMNFAWPLYPAWEQEGDYAQHRLLREVLKTVNRLNIPMVVPAHNYAEPITGGPRSWFPVSLTEEAGFDNLIGVGGVQSDQKLNVTAWFSPQLLTGFNSRGSNYGAELLWAPASSLDIANGDPARVTPGNMSGTSASCPFTTAIVTLIKSRNPALTGAEVKAILRQTARHVDAAALFGRPGHTVPMIQADAAVREALRRVSPEALRSAEQRVTLTGTLRRNQDDTRDLLTEQGTYRLIPTLARHYPGGRDPLDGKPATIRGWQGLPGMQAHELEGLTVQAPGTDHSQLRF